MEGSPGEPCCAEYPAVSHGHHPWAGWFSLIYITLAIVIHPSIHLSFHLMLIFSSVYVQCSNRDTRLLAGTTVVMLINTAPEEGAGGAAAAWSLLQVTHSGTQQHY